MAEIQPIRTLFAASKNSYLSQSYSHQTEKQISNIVVFYEGAIFQTLYSSKPPPHHLPAYAFSLIRTLQCQMRNEHFWPYFARALLPWQRNFVAIRQLVFWPFFYHFSNFSHNLKKKLRPKSKIRNDYLPSLAFIYHPVKNRGSSTPFVASSWAQLFLVSQLPLSIII